MAAEDVLAKNLGIEGFLLGVISSEAADSMGNQKATINGSLEDAKEFASSSGTSETKVKVGTERARSISLEILDQFHF